MRLEESNFWGAVQKVGVYKVSDKDRKDRKEE